MGKPQDSSNRRTFLKKSGMCAVGTMLAPSALMSSTTLKKFEGDVPVNAHLWVYASKFPPNWDATPVLDAIFNVSNLKSKKMYVNGKEASENTKAREYLPVPGKFQACIPYKNGQKPWAT